MNLFLDFPVQQFKDTPTICKFEKNTDKILRPTKVWSENSILTISGPYDVIFMTHQKFEKFDFTCNRALL